MKILSAKLMPYRLPLRAPLGAPRASPRERRGLILALKGEGQHVGLGEAAPPEWIDPGDTVEKAQAELVAVAEGLDWPVSFERLHAEAARLESRAARCALETACLDLLARARGLRLCDLLFERLGAALRCSGSPPLAVPMAALCTGRSEKIVRQEIERAAQAGFRTFKIKVAGMDAKNAARLVKAARGALPDSGALRVDANQAFSLAEAIELWRATGTGRIEFVEEPVAEPTSASLEEFIEATAVPVALDESITGAETIREIAAAGGAKAVVLKLARLGGYSAAVEAAVAAIQAGLGVVVTDALETRVGRAAAAHLAAALAAAGPAEQVAAVGLGGLFALAEDLGGRGEAAAAAQIALKGPGLGVGGRLLE